MTMKIAFYKATRPGLQGLFNRLVRWWTNGPYSHCEAVLYTDSKGVSLCASSSYIDGGVRIKIMKLDPEHWDIIDSAADIGPAYQWFTDHLGQPYDKLGLLGHVFRRGDGSRRKWYCNEAVGAAIGINEPWRQDPNSFAAVLRSNLLV